MGYNKLSREQVEKVMLLRAQGYSLQEIAKELQRSDGIIVSKQAIKYIIDNKSINVKLSPEQQEVVLSSLNRIINQLDKLNREAWDQYEKLKALTEESPKAAVAAVGILDKILKQIEMASRLKESLFEKQETNISYMELGANLQKMLDLLEKKGYIKKLKKLDSYDI